MLGAVLAAGGFLDPEKLLTSGGLLLLLAIIFAESGLLIGFFLPGDSLLFLAGFMASDPPGFEHVMPPIWLLVPLLFGVAALGDQVGYLFGRKVGPALFSRPDSRLFHQGNVRKAQGFFDRHGPKTIVLARFVPIVRTFAPILAGVAKMHYRTFVTFNLIGAFLWAVGVTMLGYYLGNISFVKDNIEIALVLIVVLSLVPMGIELVRHRRSKRHPGDAPISDPASEPAS